MRLKLLPLLVLFVGSLSLSTYAQKDTLTLKEKEKMAAFADGFSSYSRKKPAYVTLKNGTEIEGKIKKLNRKKGQIRGLKIETAEGKKEIPASEIQSLYMAPSGLDKLQKMNNYMTSMERWGRTDIKDVANKGYSLYTNQRVSLKNKKKEAEYLMQMVNPSYGKLIQVYNDPFAGETASIGFGGLKLAGGIAKSYYVRKGDKIMWLHKRDFKENFESLFFDNEKFKKEYEGKKIKWSLLGVYILDYTRFSE